MPYLIDGHNLVNFVPGLSLAAPDDEAQLVTRLHQWLARAGKRGVVFFDQGQPGHPAGGNATLQVRFVRPPRTADQAIEDFLHQTPNPAGWTVVTADQRLSMLARRLRAQVRAPAAWLREMHHARPTTVRQKTQGLSASEVAEWEQAFAQRQPPSEA